MVFAHKIKNFFYFFQKNYNTRLKSSQYFLKNSSSCVQKFPFNPFQTFLKNDLKKSFFAYIYRRKKQIVQ